MIRSSVKWILVRLYRLLAVLSGKDRSLALIGAHNGLYYSDNSKYVFEWLLARRRDIRPVWMTRSKEVHERLKADGMPVARIDSMQGMRLLHKARIGLFTNSLHDLAIDPICIPPSLQLIALRHGKSVKKVRFARESHKMSSEETQQRLLESKRIKYVISTSEFISEIQEECLLVGRDKHQVTGYPRNDVLVSPSSEIRDAWLEYVGELSPMKTILYAPSWRHGRVATEFFPFHDFERDELNAFLELRKILLLLRPHSNDLHKYANLREYLHDLSSGCPYIRLASHSDFPDVTTFLPFTDILISDYSALYHDFLLLDRPLVFIPYDYRDFEAQNGFLYDYYEHLPGPAIDNMSDLLTHVTRLCGGEDAYAEKRRALRDKIHTYQDARSCERVAELIDTIRTR